MKHFFYHIAMIAVVVAVSGCAKTAKQGPNEANIRYFKAWAEVNYPNAQTTPFGSIIIEKEDGNGKKIEGDGYLYADYIVTDLVGNVTSSTDEETARRLGTYQNTNYYGPQIINMYAGTVHKGVAEALEGMHVGGHLKVAIPGWLMTNEDYDTAEQYENREADSDECIYEFRIKDFVEDVIQWQVDSIGAYFNSHKDVFGGMTVADTVKNFTGMYYKQLKAPVDTTSFKADTTVYINYIGRLLNGKVFDTNIERVAKDNDLYSSTRDYTPAKISWGDSYSDIQMDGSSIITGFALTLWNMRPMEKGIGIFTSPYGYNTSGSGGSIPGYSPLLFEIELVEEPED